MILLFFNICIAVYGETGTNCQDFVVRKNVDYGSTRTETTLRTFRVGRSVAQAECEQKCRITPNCAGYVLQQKKICHLKSDLLLKGSTSIKGVISGEYKTVDHDGNMFQVNYCQKKMEQRHCTIREKECESQVPNCIFGFTTDAGQCTDPSCTCQEREALGQVHFGDIVVDSVLMNKMDEKRAADTSVARWDNIKSGSNLLVPYTLQYLPSGGHRAVLAGLRMLESGTCLKFVQRTNQRDYLQFYQGGGCSSLVGRQGGAQQVSLGSGCWYDYTAAHEVMHALGFWHEQMRPDRDGSVYVNLNNVSPSMRYNFNKLQQSKWTSFGQPYDITSVMQYHGYAFSANGQATIIDRKTNRAVPWNKRVSQSDFDQLNALYKCGDTTKPTTRPTTKPTGSCVNKSQNCGSWTTQGFCSGEHAAYMQENCKQSCNLCTKPTTRPTTRPTTSCADTNNNCRSWSSSGFCNNASYVSYMRLNCKSSCNLCSTSSCSDQNGSCNYWASIGECAKNPSYMNESCKKSCGQC